VQYFQPRDNPVPDYRLSKPISREEWKQGLDQSIRMGLAKPGETYEEYLAAAADAFSGLDMGDDEQLALRS